FPLLFSSTHTSSAGAHTPSLHDALPILADLVVVAVLPQDTDADQVLAQVEGTTHMGTSEKAQSSGVDLQRLVDGVFHGEIRHAGAVSWVGLPGEDRKSTRLNSSDVKTSYAVFCLRKKTCFN